MATITNLINLCKNRDRGGVVQMIDGNLPNVNNAKLFASAIRVCVPAREQLLFCDCMYIDMAAPEFQRYRTHEIRLEDDLIRIHDLKNPHKDCEIRVNKDDAPLIWWENMLLTNFTCSEEEKERFQRPFGYDFIN